MEKAFWTVGDVSKYLSVKPSTIYMWAKTGQIPHFKLNKALRFRKTEIDAWMESHRGNDIVAKEKPRRSLMKVSRPKSKIGTMIGNAVDEFRHMKYNSEVGNQVESSTQKGGDHGTF
jgi:excisionase family DNA binding protein